MLNCTIMIKSQEYELLDAIAQDTLVTQASLSIRLGMAVGSVNWYIKRLINCGYIKVSRLDRTRLKYQLTPEGLSIVTQRTLHYMKKSLIVYNELRLKAKAIVTDLISHGITHAYLEGDDEVIDIMRLTCIEAEMGLDVIPDGIVLKAVGKDYTIVSQEISIR